MQTRVTDFFLYKWRYVFGYGLLFAIIGGLLFVASNYIPGGLRPAEVDAAVKSGSLSFTSLDPKMIVNLPYYVLQRGVFALFGVSTFTIKLPSLILAFLTVIGLALLIATWHRRNIAIITTIIAATSVQFLFLAQDGTPLIMYSFLAVWLLFASTYVTRQKMFGTLWKVLAGVLFAALLYTPFGIYLAIAVLTTIIFHPHVRFIVKRFSTIRLVLAAVFGLITLLPLIYASFVDRSVIMTLLGLPEHLSQIPANIQKTALDLFGFFAPANGSLARPLYTIEVALLLGLGLVKLAAYRYTARGYICLFWGVLLIPLVLINENQATYLFPLMTLILAISISTLITDWYKLFPRNPYARVIGLIPLGILVVGVTVSGAARYLNTYHYGQVVASTYSKDLSILQGRLLRDVPAGEAKTIVVADKERPFYALLATYDKRIALATTAPSGSAVYTKAARAAQPRPGEPNAIITSSRSQDADRFYIYK